MDRVHDAVVLAATVRVAPLEPPSVVRERGSRMRRRQRVVAGSAIVVVGSIVGAGLLQLDGSSADGAPTPPAVVTPQPSPTVDPTVGTPADPVVVDGSCGHGLACPDATGSFRSTLSPLLGKNSPDLVVGYDVPAGWALWDMVAGGLAVADQGATDGSFGLYWPLAPVEGDGDARAAAAYMAGLPGALSSQPEQVEVGGRTAWRVTFAEDSGASDAGGQRSGRCIVPSVSPHPLKQAEGCLVVARTLEGRTSSTVGVTGPVPIEVTLVDVPNSDAAGNSAILGIWRSGSDLDSDSAGRSLVDSIRADTTNG